jgi:Flp pilus assembly protein TadG
MRARFRGRSDNGAAATTVAILFPAVMVFVMLAVQAGLYWHAIQRAEAAADRAASVAARIDGSEVAGEAAGWAFLDAAPLEGADVSVTRGATQAEATVSGSAPALVMGMKWQVTAHATVELERFVAEPDRP